MRPFEFPRRAVESTAGALAGSGIDRRDFLVRTAAFGSALAVAPLGTILRPQSAAASHCPSPGCSSGYSAFCCTLTGSNSCPSGTKAGGWWRASVSTKICSGGNRYYLDCIGNCDCSQCRCANDPPTRRVCCNHGYTNCGGSFSDVLRCRVVICEPPCGTKTYSHCSCAGGTDQQTCGHGANCVAAGCP